MTLTAQKPDAERGHALPPLPVIASAGKVNVIALDEFKTRLGGKWERLSDLVRSLFETAIRKALRPGDLFWAYDELAYVVMFRDLSLAEAQMKCTSIAEDVCSRLFGQEQEKARIRQKVGLVDTAGSGVLNARSRDEIVQALEQHGWETITPGDLSRQEHEAAVRVAAVDNPHREHLLLRRDNASIFRPVWDSNRKAVLTYIGQHVPVSAPPGETKFGSWIAAGSEAIQSDIDIDALEACTTRIADVQSKGRRLIIAAPLAFSTLARSRYWQTYSERLRRLPPTVARDLTFVLLCPDPGLPNLRLAEEIPKLQPRERKIFCQISEPSLLKRQFASVGAHAIAYAVPAQRTPEKQIMAAIALLAQDARQSGTEACVLGLRTTSLALSSIRDGVRYLEGPSIRPPVAHPQYAYSQDVEDLYRGKFDAKQVAG